MDSLWRGLRDPASFDAHSTQVFFASSTPLPAAVICLYLVLVRLGPRWMESRPPYQLRTTARVWNIFVALFSMMGAYYCVPHLASQWYVHGFWYTTCADVYELAGSGHVALWAVLFTWSKLFELFDTALLVMRKRKLITLHWFHHASVIAFAWGALAGAALSPSPRLVSPPPPSLVSPPPPSPSPPPTPPQLSPCSRVDLRVALCALVWRDELQRARRDVLLLYAHRRACVPRRGAPLRTAHHLAAYKYVNSAVLALLQLRTLASFGWLPRL